MPPFIATPFIPRAFLTNGHLQTIFGNFLPRPDHLPAPTPQLVEVSPATESQMSSQVLCQCHWQPAEVRSSRMTAILLHGLEGSSDSQYVIGNANKLWRAGMNVVRMNMRNCGGTEALSPTLYHSGLSGDVNAVLNFFLASERLERIALVGYSMGGNLVLKLTGELAAGGPPQLRGAVGVSPAIDLGPSADALHRPLNRLYERRFLRALLRRFRKKTTLFPQVFDPARADGLHSLRDLDDRITAFYSGFSGADDYYRRAAAARVVDRIRIPTLILHALDDPFVELTAPTRALIAANPAVTLVETPHGGHCAFLARPNPAAGDDGYWAETTLLRLPCSRCPESPSQGPEIIDTCSLNGPAECAADDPVLVVPWHDPATGAAFVDLRLHPYDFDHLPEAELHPPLMQALRALNAPRSPVFTAKCDAWVLSDEELEHLRLNLDVADAPAGFASYIDLLWRERSIFASFHQQEQQLHRLSRLATPLDHPYAALDCVLRPAFVDLTGPQEGFAVSLYIRALGPDHDAATQLWSSALESVVSLLRSRDLATT